ncbi:MAG: class I SAM-dependent methyltransferase [Actinobacteria bacterium]|nr:class I SAM-dependent methyltransferase [Actinomycetota bacterium]
MKKLSDEQYVDFWRNIHSKTHDDLAAVCFPDKPLYFNRFFDRIQKYALTKYFVNERVSLADKEVLDVGCGRGRWLSFFKEKHSAIATGVDISRDAVQACVGRGLNACEGSITDMPFEDDHFDFISSITVLLHLPYGLKEEAVAEVSRVLKPGGKVILIENTWEDPSPHVYSLSVPGWVTLFKDYGMNLVHISGHCFNLFRMKLPSRIPFRDFMAIYLDYPLEYSLMNYFYSKQSDIALQHLMVFEK